MRTKPASRLITRLPAAISGFDVNARETSRKLEDCINYTLTRNLQVGNAGIMISVSPMDGLAHGPSRSRILCPRNCYL